MANVNGEEGMWGVSEDTESIDPKINNILHHIHTKALTI